MPSHLRRPVPVLLLLLVLATPLRAGVQQADFWLTLLHNNDGESHLIDEGTHPEHGGAARFTTLVKKCVARAEQFNREKQAQGHPAAWLFLSSGDNFLAGPEFAVSQEKGPPYYDAILIDRLPYDALTLGNHDFDYGAEVLATFIQGTAPDLPFLSANVDFAPEPALHALTQGPRPRIVPSIVVERAGRKIGIVGITTPRIRYISSPGKLGIHDEVEPTRREISRLTAQGVDIIVLSCHLQAIENEVALVSQIEGADLVIAGGGNELLANQDHVLMSATEEKVHAPYPLVVKDRAGIEVPIVTTAGSYRYLGRIVTRFDGKGRLVEWKKDESGPLRVIAGDLPDASAPDPEIQETVVGPVARALEELGKRTVARTEVVLEGRRPELRSRETNLADLVADSLLWAGRRWAREDPAHAAPDVALVNAGAIRNNSRIEPGNISALDSFHLLPFPNFVTVVPAVPAAQLKEILENGVSRVEEREGRFLHVSGMHVVWDPAGVAQKVDESGKVTSPGARIRHVVLHDGRVLVRDGQVETGAPAVGVSTISYLAAAGDASPYRQIPYTMVAGLTYQQAFLEYVDDVLAGVIDAARHAEPGWARMRTVTEQRETKVRFATFNSSLYRKEAGALVRELASGNCAQARTIAEIIQRQRPDVIFLNEFDFDEKREAVDHFQRSYLAVARNGAAPIHYPYSFSAPTNTGLLSGKDLDGDGKIELPRDGFGFGLWHGEYGMLVLSRFPVVRPAVRTFQTFRWKDMPGGLWSGLYPDDVLEILRLSSKNHHDVPVDLGGPVVHLLGCHPTPPHQDGPEDRNGKRNHDEVRLWLDYVTPGKAGYLYDDAGAKGGLPADARFVIVGDLNVDPEDGDSRKEAIQGLLGSDRVRSEPVPASEGGKEQAALQGGNSVRHAGDSAHDTADFPEARADGGGAPGNLRVDYVLPSRNLELTGQGVFWPAKSDPLHRLVDRQSASGSDHHLVWIDVKVP